MSQLILIVYFNFLITIKKLILKYCYGDFKVFDPLLLLLESYCINFIFDGEVGD